MEFPSTLIELQDRFPDEASCWRYLMEVRWPEGFRCPHCGSEEHSYLEGRRLFQCAACRRQTSVTARTVLHRTRTPLRKWFLAIFFVARHKQGISALQLQRDPYPTAQPHGLRVDHRSGCTGSPVCGFEQWRRVAFHRLRRCVETTAVQSEGNPSNIDQALKVRRRPCDWASTPARSRSQCSFRLTGRDCGRDHSAR